jgi:hypothetical protein
MGSAVGVLGTAHPALFDRHSTLEVELLADDMVLVDATPEALASGANKAQVGAEVVQFLRAVPLGARRWRLEGWLRGRGGTEQAVAGHAAGEPFVLLDGTPTALDPATVGTSVEIAAIGLADSTPVLATFVNRGITQRPLAPVHPRVVVPPVGGLLLSWTRRARGAWTWPDGIDAPLAEQVESYLISFGPLASPLAYWEVAEPRLELSATALADLSASLPGGSFLVRQRGTHALSEPLLLATLP